MSILIFTASIVICVLMLLALCALVAAAFIPLTDEDLADLRQSANLPPKE